MPADLLTAPQGAPGPPDGAAATAFERPDLSIVMPVYNESEALPRVLQEAAATVAKAPFRAEIVLVDDASNDDSLALLQAWQKRHPELAIRILRHETNRGIAASCATLYAAARGAYVFLNASDGQCRADEALRMMELRDRFDIVVGKRRDKHYSWGRAVISAAFNLLPALLFGVRTHDAGSIKLIRVELLRIPLASRSPFAEAERIIRARRRGFRVGVLGVESSPRRGGKARGARWRVVMRALHDALCCWWRVVVCRER
jgi:glycosyltransferase involved in cell wall biosynthesis